MTKSGGCIIGAFDNEILVGSSAINICQNFSGSGRPYAIIENVTVTKKYRNKGIGKAVLQYSKEVAKKSNCDKVELMTGSKKTATHKFYESAGLMANKTGYQARFIDNK